MDAKGRKGAFRYLDQRGRQITRRRRRSSGSSSSRSRLRGRTSGSRRARRAKLQATGYDKAGRKQYLYHPDFRAAQEQAKYDKLIRFAEKLPELRAAMAEHLDKDGLDRERVSAIALRLINLGWFRVGSERYARESRHVRDHDADAAPRRPCAATGSRSRSAASTRSRCGRRSWTRSSPRRCGSCSRSRRAARVFRYEWEGGLVQPDEQAAERLREGSTWARTSRAKDFRTWGGTLLAAVALRRAREPRRLPRDEDRREALGQPP